DMGYPEKGDREPEKTEGRVEGVLRGQSRGERRVWRTVSCDVRAKVSAGEVHEGTWGQGGLQSTEYGGRMKADGRGVALPRPHGDRRARHSLAPTASEARVVKSRFGHHVANGRDAVASLPASGARERQGGQHVVLSLPYKVLAEGKGCAGLAPTRELGSREAARLARSANPTRVTVTRAHVSPRKISWRRGRDWLRYAPGLRPDPADRLFAHVGSPNPRVLIPSK
ncbi:MAG: hypothetical protein RL492_1623, partial [Verrucomicrobiota bacterium]